MKRILRRWIPLPAVPLIPAAMLFLAAALPAADGRLAPAPPDLPAAPETAAPKTIETAIAALGTREWDRAVEVLAAIGEPAVEPLIAATRSEVRFIPGRACLALARIGTPRANEAVLAATHSPGIPLRAGAAEALRYIPPAAAVPRLLELVAGDPAPPVRREAAAALGFLRAPEATGPLVALLDDTDEYTRVAAIEALGRIRSAQATPRLTAALVDPSFAVRSGARAVLIQWGEHALPALRAALAAGNPALRWQAACALGRITADEAAETLVPALRDPDWRVRNEAAVGLARGRAARIRPALHALAEDADPEVRAEAAWILSEMDAPPAGVSFRETGLPLPAERIEPKTALYPETLPDRPDLPSPAWTIAGEEVVITRTASDRWAVVPVTPANTPEKGRQRCVDAGDFPALAATGLHSEAELDRLRAITGRSVAEITELGRPGGLSTDGFMAGDEDIVSVLRGDNRLVAALGLTHPELARPLFHVWNLILTDLGLHRWDMAAHRWSNMAALAYHGRTVYLDAGDTKGGQESIFDDGLQGAFWMELRVELDPAERAWMQQRYGRLGPERLEELIRRLTRISTGEMEPYYIQWYGFYEGHSGWRTDPLAIAFVFGLRRLEDLERAFPGRLPEVLEGHFTRDGQ